LVQHINRQLAGVSDRLNVTLDNFDRSVAGIASDAGNMTHQVQDTVTRL
jgi:hypothetical protein